MLLYMILFYGGYNLHLLIDFFPYFNLNIYVVDRKKYTSKVPHLGIWMH